MSVSIYDGTNGVLKQIAGREDTSFWEGTQAQWDALSSADKALWTGKYVIITDDEGENEKVTFTSNDIANTDTSKTDSGWTNTEILTSGETLPNICTKVSNMFKNIRRLWNTVGTTTIPSGLGTNVTEAITELNSNIGIVTISVAPTSNQYVSPFTHYANINIESYNPQGYSLLGVFGNNDELTESMVYSLGKYQGHDCIRVWAMNNGTRYFNLFYVKAFKNYSS